MMNGAVTSARFNVSAVNSMSDEPLLISISNLPAKRKLTIRSSVTADNGALFECIAIYNSSEKGFIDLSEDPAIGGMYKGIEPMGLFWAMDPSKLNKKKYNRLTKTNVETPQVHNFVVYDNIVDNLDDFYQLKSKGQLKNLASTQVNRWFMAKGTKRSLLTVEKHGIHGTLFIPPGEGPFPGILVMFGGYPGTMEYKASLFSSHGYAALALAYYGAAGLPKIDFERFSQGGSLKMEYFETAVQLLLKHSSVDSKGIAVFGSSASGPIALAIGSCLKGIRAVVWVNSFTNVHFFSLEYRGKIIYTPAPIHHDIFEKERVAWTRYRAVYHTPTNPLDPIFTGSVLNYFEKRNIAYLFIAGLCDNTVPSEYQINKAEKLLKMANHPNYKLIRCAGSGHLIEPPYTICNLFHGTFGKPHFANWGGTKLPHCRNQEKVWKEHLAFLKSNLRPPISKL